MNCARCHGEYGLGSTIAPSLYHSFQSGAVDSAEYQQVVHGSRTAKGMPNWKGMLSEEYLHAIYKYLVRARRRAGSPPGGRLRRVSASLAPARRSPRARHPGRAATAG